MVHHVAASINDAAFCQITLVFLNNTSSIDREERFRVGKYVRGHCGLRDRQ